MKFNTVDTRKKVTPRNIAIVSIILIAIIIAFSLILEARSQKLPAQVKTEQLVISSVSSGIAVNYKVILNESVQKGQLLFEMENPQIQNRLSNLKNEKSKYEEIIESSSIGDHLKIKLMDIENNLLIEEEKQVEINLNKEKIASQLNIFSNKFNSAKTNYEAYKELYNQNKISSIEFEESTSKFMGINNSYQNLQNELLLINKEITSNLSKIDLYKQQKELYKDNVSLIADEYILELTKINSEILELEDEISFFKVYSPSDGYITKLNLTSGENVNKGDQILELSFVDKIGIVAFGNSFSRQKINQGMKVLVYCTNGKKIYGIVDSVSPIMDRVSTLSTKFETASSYTKIEISLSNVEDASNNLTPGERLFIRVYFR